MFTVICAGSTGNFGATPIYLRIRILINFLNTEYSVYSYYTWSKNRCSALSFTIRLTVKIVWYHINFNLWFTSHRFPGFSSCSNQETAYSVVER
ncbi:unnamed protein product [Leptidea sinapis]|uniref:Uncharacterized protein n=1 Tax=Leptidea sinapis TaxID=189913 RepID=A0A5E4Q5H9_9NEOP|nr:unnamed protein product [Leptidea sinapis]